MGANSNDEDDFTACCALRKAEKTGGKKEVEGGGSKKVQGKVTGGGQTLNGAKKNSAEYMILARYRISPFAEASDGEFARA